MRIKPCFYQNIEEEIPAQHQQLVRRIYTLWKCELFSSTLFNFSCSLKKKKKSFHFIYIYTFKIKHCNHLLSPLSIPFSVFRYTVHEYDLLYCLVGWGWKCHQLWLLTTLVHPLQSLQLHLLVQATLQSLQVSQSLIRIVSELFSSIYT